MSPDEIRALLPLLLGLPILAAFACLAAGKSVARARGTGLIFSLLHLGLTVAIVYSALIPMTARSAGIKSFRDRGPVFLPEFVPGDRGIEKKNRPVEIKPDLDTHRTRYDLLRFSKEKYTEEERIKNSRKIGAIQFYIGLDGINLWMIALSSLLLVSTILVSWDGIRENPGAFYFWLFLLQAGAIGVFLAFDIILFYVCFELTLVPLFFLIGNWGLGPTRREAARKLFLYTLAGGLITLIGIAASVLFVYNQTGFLTFSIPDLAEKTATVMQTTSKSPDKAALIGLKSTQLFIFLALVVGFAVKIPLIPFHTWLPGAYTEAPIGVTVMLSSILAKMGTFGLLRLCLPLAPDATLQVGMPLIGVLAAAGILYGAFCAYAQTDFKRVVAYSSISHLGFCALAIVAFTYESMMGGLLHMVNHGLSTGALFLLVGLLIDRYGTSRLVDYSGMWARLPKLTFFFMMVALASVGLPGLNNFVSEVLMLFGIINLSGGAKFASLSFGVIAGFGIFLSAWYTLTFVQKIFFGPLREPPPAQPAQAVKDLTRREFYTVAPLAMCCLILGLAPRPVISTMDRDIHALAILAKQAHDRTEK